jgi:hypothetical protein
VGHQRQDWRRSQLQAAQPSRVHCQLRALAHFRSLHAISQPPPQRDARAASLDNIAFSARSPAVECASAVLSRKETRRIFRESAGQIMSAWLWLKTNVSNIDGYTNGTILRVPPRRNEKCQLRWDFGQACLALVQSFMRGPRVCTCVPRGATRTCQKRSPKGDDERPYVCAQIVTSFRRP